MFGSGSRRGILSMATGGGLSIPSLWPTGTEPGGWWSNRGADLGAGTQNPTVTWKESTGVTQAVAIADPVGLWLDRRLGLGLGADICLNGGFADASNWIVGSGWAVGGGVATYTHDSIGASIAQLQTILSGETWEITFTVTAISGDAYIQATLGGVETGGNLSTSGAKRVLVTAGANRTQLLFFAFSTTGSVSIDNVTFKKLPGLHLSQATAAARPLKQARINLLTATRLLSGAGWTKRGTAAVGVGTAPDGTGETVTGLGANSVNDFYQTPVSAVTGMRYEPSLKIWPISVAGTLEVSNSAFAPAGTWAINLALLTTGTWNTITRSHAAVSISSEFSGSGSSVGMLFDCSAGAPISFYIKSPQINIGTTSDRYQWCDTATSYDTSGFPVFEQFDGVDDGLASATVAAGVVGNSNMYVATLVKRLSAAKCILINGDLTTKYLFGVDPAGGATSATGNAGTPTYRVDGVAVAATEVALDAALTVGAWHVVEAIGADLSAWTQWGTDSTAAYFLNGGINEIASAPNPSAAVQAKIRRDLYALAGITGA